MAVLTKTQVQQGQTVLGGSPGGSFSLPGASYYSGEAQRAAQNMFHISLPPLLDNIEGQVQAGQQIYAQIMSGDVQGLLGDGIDLIGNAVGGIGGTVIDVGGGALAGLAIAGPWGAAAAGILGALQDIFGGGSGPDTVVGILGESMATRMISGCITTMLKKNSSLHSAWAMADYLAFARPPSKTKNAKRFFTMMQNIAGYAWSTDSSFSQPYWSRMDGPSNLANALCGDSGFNPSCNKYTAQQFAGWQEPLCTPIWFDWGNPSAIKNCSEDLLFGAGGAGGNNATLLQRWTQATPIIPGLSQAQIVAAAIAKAPDPMYWGADLYGTPTSSGGGYATYYYNVDLLNGMATVLIMRSMGASSMAVVAELLNQAYLLKVHGDKDPNGNPLSGNATNRQYGFFQLLNDSIQQAIADDANMAPAQAGAASSFWTAGTIAAAVGLAAVGGLLGYSAYTRQSPVDVLRSMKSGIRARI